MTVSNQLILELPDFGDMDLVQDETTDPMFMLPLFEPELPKKAKPKCDCGSWAVGVQDYMTGHNLTCPVHEDNTPVL